MACGSAENRVAPIEINGITNMLTKCSTGRHFDCNCVPANRSFSTRSVLESHTRSRGSVKRAAPRANPGHSFPNVLHDWRPWTQSLRITSSAFHVGRAGAR